MSLKLLTDIAIQRLPVPEKGQQVYYEPTGLGLRVSQGGTKSFVVQLGGERRRKTLGRYPQMSLKEARVAAVSAITDYNPDEENPPSEDVISVYLSHCERKNKASTVDGYRKILRRYFPIAPIRSIDRATIIKVFRSLGDRPGQLHHVTASFQAFLNWCVNNGYLDFNPIAGLKNQGHTKPRERVLDDFELIAIWKNLPHDRYGTYVKLLILTGQRRSEIPNIRIVDDTAFIAAAYTKNRRSHAFPVGPITKETFEPVTWNGWGKSKRRLEHDTGVTGWTYHDLRRTFASNHARLGTPIHVIEKMLNHVSGTFAGVAGVYNRYSYMDEMREACLRYEDWIASNCS
ncbi:MAG: integrase family protein [Pseudomonadota bacterium]